MSEATLTQPSISVKHVQQPLMGQSPEQEKLDIFKIVNENPSGKTEEVIEESKKVEPVTDEFVEEPVTEEIPVVKEFLTTEESIEIPIESESTATSEQVSTEPEKAEELPVGRKAANAAFAAKDREVRDLKKKLAEVEPLAKKLLDLEKQLAETPKADPEIVTRLTAVEKELEKATRERDAYRQRLSVTDVTQSDEYQSLVLKPFNEDILPAILDIEKATNGEVSKAYIDSIISNPDPVKRREMVRSLKDKLDSGDYNELAALIPKYRQVAVDRNRLTQNASEVLALQAREKENMSKQQQEQYTKAIKGEFSNQDACIRKEAFGDFDISSDTELKIALDEAGSKAEAFDWYNAPVQAQAAIKAALKNFPVALMLTKKQLSDTKIELEKVTKELTDLKTATKKIVKSSPQAGSTTTGAQKVDNDPKEVDVKLTGGSLAEMLRT